MLYYSNAKINLGLNVIEKRGDGFHNIETVFYPIGVKDALEFIPSDSIGLESSGIEIDCSLEDNLIVKAYRLLQKDFDISDIKFHSHKLIPFGAGLGGGSANAAYTLLELNRFFNLDLSESKLLEYARQLGSDCAFFIKNKPVYAEKKGDVFTDLSLNLSAYKLLLIHPGFGISTPEAYANIIPNKPQKSVKQIVRQPIETWTDELINDFELSVFLKYPILKDIKEDLYSKGAIFAAMSGSGSSLFGIFKDLPNTDDFNKYWTWKGRL